MIPKMHECFALCGQSSLFQYWPVSNMNLYSPILWVVLNKSWPRLIWDTVVTTLPTVSVWIHHWVAACLSEGLIQAYIGNPTSSPYVGKQFTALFHTTTVYHSCVLMCRTTINCIFKFKPTAMWHYSTLLNFFVITPQVEKCLVNNEWMRSHKSVRACLMF